METGSGALRRHLTGIFLTLLLVPLCVAAQSRPTVRMADSDSVMIPNASQQRLLCSDASHLPPATTLLRQPDNYAWQAVTNAVVNLGFTRQHCWLRWQLDGTSDNAGQWMLRLDYTLLDHLEVWIQQGEQPPQQFQAGFAQPFTVRPVRYRKPTFPVALLENQRTTVLIGTHSSHTIQLPLALWRAPALAQQDARADQKQALFFGAMLVMLLYNLLLYLSVRENAYLFYVGWTACLTALVAVLQGYPQQYLWPQSALLGSHVLTILLPLIVVIGSHFTSSFLELSRHRPGLALLTRVHARAALLMLVMASFIPLWLSIPLSMLLILSFDLSVLFIISQRVRAGDEDAHYFAVAWLCLLAGGLLIALNKFALLPRTPLTENLLQVGVLLDVLLLALALAARINRLKAAQTEATRLRGAMSTLQANSRNQAKSEFLATMSHQIRTPMQGILGMADLLRRGEGNPERQRQYADTIYNASDALIDVLNDLLDHSRIESGHLTLTPGEARLEEIVSDVVSLFVSGAGERDLPIYTYIDSRVPALVITDAVRVKQIMTNLLSNAIRFTEKGQIAIAVSVRTPVDASGRLTLALEVTDTGIGLDESLRAQILGDHPEQLGLGLSVARKLCALLGGEFGVTSSPGHGACFHFTLPCQLAPEQPDNGCLPGHRVLVITSRQALRLSVCQLAERWGMEAQGLSLAQASGTDATLDADILVVDQHCYLALGSRNPSPVANMPWVVLAERDQKLIVSTPANRPLLELPLEARRLRTTLMTLLDHSNSTPASTESEQQYQDELPQRVLVVDDDVVSQVVIRSLLESMGLEPEIATSGDQAAASVAPAQPHWQVIFMDCEMPGMNGYDATRAIRQREQEQGREPCWIIGLSAHAGADAVTLATDAGMNDYLCKPVTRDQLHQALLRANWPGRD